MYPGMTWFDWLRTIPPLNVFMPLQRGDFWEYDTGQFARIRPGEGWEYGPSGLKKLEGR